jgi:hypothetical protein
MAHINLEQDAVAVHLSLADEILALHGTFHIPYAHIAAVSTAAVPSDWFRGIRIGTNLPGVKVAGTFITGDGLIFYDFHDGEYCITLDLTHERYTRVSIEVDPDQDRDELARDLKERIARA